MDSTICNFSYVRIRLECQLLTIKRIISQLFLNCNSGIIYSEIHSFNAERDNYLALLHRLNKIPNIVLSLPLGSYFKTIINDELRAYSDLIKRMFIYGSHSLLTEHEYDYLKYCMYPNMTECFCKHCLDTRVNNMINTVNTNDTSSNTYVNLEEEPSSNTDNISQNQNQDIEEGGSNSSQNTEPNISDTVHNNINNDENTIFRFRAGEDTDEIPSFRFSNVIQNNPDQNATVNNLQFPVFIDTSRSDVNSLRLNHDIESGLSLNININVNETEDENNDSEEDDIEEDVDVIDISDDEDDELNTELEDVSIKMTLNAYNTQIEFIENDVHHNQNDCCICLEKIKVEKPDNILSSLIAQTPCKHIFHHLCLQRLCCETGPPKCPLCRHDIREQYV